MVAQRERQTIRIIDALYVFAEQQACDGAVVSLPRPYDGSFPIEATGIDSLSAAALAVHLETCFGVEIDFAAFLRARALRDVVDVVLNRLFEHP